MLLSVSVQVFDGIQQGALLKEERLVGDVPAFAVYIVHQLFENLIPLISRNCKICCADRQTDSLIELEDLREALIVLHDQLYQRAVADTGAR